MVSASSPFDGERAASLMLCARWRKPGALEGSVNRTLGLSLALALLLPAVASAEEEENVFGRTGLYAGVGAVLGIDNFESTIGGDVSKNLQRRADCPDPNVATFKCVHRPLGPAPVDLNETGGVDAWIGYRVHRFLAVEAELEWMALLGFKSEERISGDGQARDLDLDIDTLVITGNLKPYFWTGRIQPFGLLGAGIMMEEFGVEYDGVNDDEHHTDFAMRFGGGIDYYATENVVLTIKGSYLLTFGAVSDRDYVSVGMLGLSYRF
jgi:opacity protein-like surface antigen